MAKLMLHSAMKAQQWEITKGHLRAMAALDGSVISGEYERPFRYEIIEKFIEGFISEFENNGYHEGRE